MVKVDLRTVTLNVPPQEVITKDNVPVRVNAVAYFRIVEPNASIVQVENYMVATSQIAQTTLRSVLGQHVLDELLSERDKINAILQGIIDEATSPWGIKVSVVEVKDVEIPSGMQRAMARQAEAERERRAKVISAEGEFQASERLKDAAAVMSQEPITVQLRYLQTLLEIGSANNSTIVFPIPIDLLTALSNAGGRRQVASYTSLTSLGLLQLQSPSRNAIATACARVRAESRASSLCTCVRTVSSVIQSAPCDLARRVAVGDQREHLALARRDLRPGLALLWGWVRSSIVPRERRPSRGE